MKRNLLALSRLRAVFLLLLVAACSPASPAAENAPAIRPTSENSQVQAIQEIRPILGLPDLPLEYVEETGMANSPNGNLKVAAYKDSQDRKYFVDILTDRVVEIDGRALLSRANPAGSALPPGELRSRAEKMAREAFPDFASLQSKLTYDEGQKGDNTFFTWRDEYSPLSFNRPFLQLAFVKDGRLFAYYNTLYPK